MSGSFVLSVKNYLKVMSTSNVKADKSRSVYSVIKSNGGTTTVCAYFSKVSDARIYTGVW